MQSLAENAIFVGTKPRLHITGYAPRVAGSEILTEADVERIVAETSTLCAIPAPTFAEQQRGAVFLDLLITAGVPATFDTVGNVVARLGGPGPALALCAHLDTVFPGDAAVDVRRDGARLVAPGIGDNALGLAALLHVARVLVQEPPVTPVLLAATVGEEGLGDLSGVTALLDREPVRALIAIEGHGVDSLAVGGIVSVRLRVDFVGPGGHSWSDRGRGSAVHALLAAGDRLLTAAPPATLNVGIVEGGTAVNAIAEHASMLIDIRHADARIVDAANARVRRALAFGLPDGVTVEICEVGNRPGGTNRPDAPLIAAAHAARLAVGLGLAEEQLASTDANAALARGIPAVAIGISRGDHAHRADEWIAIPPIGLGVAGLVELVRRVTRSDFSHK